MPGWDAGVGTGKQIMQQQGFPNAAEILLALGTGPAGRVGQAAAPEIGPIAARVYKAAMGKLKQPLEKASTYLEPLSSHTDKLFRETSLDGLFDLVGNRMRDMRGEMWLSNSVNMARGQGMNKGVMLEFEPGALRGQLNLNKPGLSQVYTSGEAEFVARHNAQEAYREALKSFVIHPQAVGDRWLMKNLRDFVFPSLEKAGWQKEILEDGAIFMKKP